MKYTITQFCIFELLIFNPEYQIKSSTLCLKSIYSHVGIMILVYACQSSWPKVCIFSQKFEL